MVGLLLAGLISCSTAPAEPAPVVQIWTQPQPARVEAQLTLPAAQRRELVALARSELSAAAHQQGLRRLESIQVDLRCTKGECVAAAQAMALP